MVTRQTNEVIEQLRRAVLLPDGAGLTDEQLLKNYLHRRDEAALAVLVCRHAPMVWGVCRRVLSNLHDAEDAFQATFLVLVRRAASIAVPGLLANWLYGVAHQTALKARTTTAKRRTREKQVTEMPEQAVTEQLRNSDLQPLLDQELRGLPDKYRVAIVLCDLEGNTRKEAAGQLGVPEGTLAARLTRGREMLGKRLARRGVVLSGGSLAAALEQEAAASGPTVLVTSTIKTASLFAVGQAAEAGAISVTVAALTEGVLKTMGLNKFKIVALALLALLVLGVGLAMASLLNQTPPEQKPPARTEEQVVQKPGDAQGVWRITKVDIKDGEIREQFEKLGKVIIKGNKATLVLDLMGLDPDKKEIWIADFTILKVAPTKSPATIDLRLDKRTVIWSPKDDPDANKPKTIQGIYSLEGDTLKLFFDEEGRPKAFPQKEKQGVVTLKREKQAGKKDAPKPKGKVEPPGAPLAAVLKANKDTYKLDLGGRTAQEFRKFARESSDFNAGGPLPPKVDLVLEVRNTSDKDIQFFTLPDLAEIVLDLEGPDALTVKHKGFVPFNRLLPKAVTLGPGKVFTRPIGSLSHGQRDSMLRSYWLAPGGYTLTVRFLTAVLPAPEGAVVNDGRLEPELKGFAEVTVTTPPLTLKVIP